MKRWHEDVQHCKRQKRIDDRHHDAFNSGGRFPGRQLPLGKYRKRHALDCGKVQCYICHNDKYPKRSKHEHEERSDQDYKEQLREFWEGDHS